MTNPDVDVLALAKLARLEVPEEELATLQKEIPSILAFVETIQKAATEAEHKGTGLRNIMRPDESPHESGIHTEALLSAAPDKKDNRVAVKQVISRKQS